MTLSELLERAARERAEAVFLRTAEGDLTYGETRRRAAQLAASFAEIGVRRGEPVVLLMNNSLDQLITWFALARLGAVHVPLNTALIGERLVHAARTTEPAMAVVDDDLLDALLPVLSQVPSLRTVIVRGDSGRASMDGRVRFADLRTLFGTSEQHDVVEVDELEAATVLFTSGTTGVSKGCTLSHRYLVRQAQLHAENLGLTATDVLYAPFPLFHIDATTLTVGAALTVGGTAAIGRRFSASRFWDEVRTFEATVFNFMGATLSMLWKQPGSPGDRDHRVRLAWGVPIPEWRDGWVERFGIPLYEIYGLTDAGIPVYERPGQPAPPGSCGRVIPEFDVRIVDGNDREVEAGVVGEILIRANEPGLIMNGYWKMPDETAQAMRGGWFHTGDLGSLDGEHHLYFAGRASDSIRRRGENISAFEVEQSVTSHPDVLEAAAFGVPSPLTEEDVKVCVVVRPGRRLHLEDLVAHCRARTPSFMVPRYFEIVSALPKTPTQKVEKFQLRAAGVTPATYDVEGT